MVVGVPRRPSASDQAVLKIGVEVAARRPIMMMPMRVAAFWGNAESVREVKVRAEPDHLRKNGEAEARREGLESWQHESPRQPPGSGRPRVVFEEIGIGLT